MRQEFVHELTALQSRELSLDDFELWLVGHLQQIIEERNPEIQGFADRLDALLIQFHEGVISRGEMDEAIESVLRSLQTIREEFVLIPWPAKSEGTASDRTIESPIKDPEVVLDLRLPVFQVV